MVWCGWWSVVLWQEEGLGADTCRILEALGSKYEFGHNEK